MESDSRKEGIRQSWSWESIDVAAMWCLVAALGTNHIQSERNPSITPIHLHSRWTMPFFSNFCVSFKSNGPFLSSMHPKHSYHGFRGNFLINDPEAYANCQQRVVSLKPQFKVQQLGWRAPGRDVYIQWFDLYEPSRQLAVCRGRFYYIVMIILIPSYLPEILPEIMEIRR